MTAASSRALRLRRLKQVAPELYRAVADGSMALHPALVQAGLRPAYVTIPMEPSLVARLDAEAARRGISRSEMGREIVAYYFEAKERRH